MKKDKVNRVTVPAGYEIVWDIVSILTANEALTPFQCALLKNKLLKNPDPDFLAFYVQMIEQAEDKIEILSHEEEKISTLGPNGYN